jgi:hypothetical protein
MADGVLGARWAALGEQVEAELASWRREHPRATLAEIELLAEAAAARLQAAIVDALAGEEAARAEASDRPTCPVCGGRLRRRGRRRRAILLPHQRQPLALERDYLWCPACGAGLSPPR